MFLVVSLHGSLEVGQVIVYLFVYGNINFCRSGPKHNHAVEILFGLELADVFAESFNHFPAGLAGHYVVTVEALGVVVVKSCL